MNFILTAWLLVQPLTDAPYGIRIPAGTWPAGTLAQAASRLGERPVFPESPTIGNTPVVLERDLLLVRGSLPAILSLLYDHGIALVELSPGDPDDGWIATRQTRGVDRPIQRKVKVLPMEHREPELLALLLNQRAEEREADLPPGDEPTRFVADPRTGSLIIRYTSEERLREYLETLTDLDRPSPPGESTPVLRTYRPQWVLASDLKVLLEAEWEKLGGHAIRVVVPPQRNLVLVRCPEQTWTAVREVLLGLDRQQP